MRSSTSERKKITKGNMRNLILKEQNTRTTTLKILTTNKHKKDRKKRGKSQKEDQKIKALTKTRNYLTK